MSHVRTISVSGAVTGTAPLTWGQRAILRSMEWVGDDVGYFNMGYRVAVPTGTDVDDVVAALRTVLVRHAALRTRFVETAGEMRQVVDGAGAICLEVHEVSADKVAPTVRDLHEQRRSIELWPERDWPLRAYLVTASGGSSVLLLVLSHHAVDGAGALLLVAELERLLGGGLQDVTEEPASLLDIAAEEATTPLLRRHARALEYWRLALTDAPTTLFDYPAHPAAQPRFQALMMASQAVTLAADEIAARRRVTNSTVLCAAAACVLGQVTGHTDLAMQIIVNNRFDTRRRGVVGTFAQDGLLRVDLTGRSFDEAVTATLGGMLRAYQSGYYEPHAIRRLRADLARERGAEIDISAYFNDVRPADLRPATGPNVTEEQLAALTSETTIVEAGGWPRVDATYFVTTGVQGSATTVQLLADTTFVPLPDMRLALSGMERLLVRAATAQVSAADIGTVTGVRAVRTRR
ncbi:condensation domain-containing protein [Plantactinospora sp. B6F1]|uniref:condensation domain-containing protein n=1 Tax=Plantactinospora sp. B6F1 TaxID=3158971 RepID=UPI0032D8B94C